MSKVRDFNLIKAGEVNATSTNTNSVNVVVNADTSGQSSNANFTVPPTPTPNLTETGGVIYAPSLLPAAATVEVPPEYQQQIEELTNELSFYKLISSILSDILKDNNPKLIVNLIDQSGKIILTGEQLIQLIAIKTKKDEKDINLRYKDEEPGCFSKIKPIKDIQDIKINNESFSLKYNAEYNILKDDYNISLDRVIINPVITYS